MFNICFGMPNSDTTQWTLQFEQVVVGGRWWCGGERKLGFAECVNEFILGATNCQTHQVVVVNSDGVVEWNRKMLVRR